MLGQHQVVLTQGFPPFQKRAPSNITSPALEVSPGYFPASQLFLTEVQVSASSILDNAVMGAGPMERTKCLALSSKLNSRDVPTYLSILFSILEVK